MFRTVADRGELTGIETPQFAVCEEPVLLAAMLQVGFYLFGWILSLALAPDRPIQTDAPHFGVSDKSSMLPILNVGSACFQGGVAVCCLKKQRIISPPSTQRRLAEKGPAETSENRAYELLFKIRLVVLRDSLSLFFPQEAKLSDQILGGATKVAPLGLQTKPFPEPMV